MWRAGDETVGHLFFSGAGQHVNPRAMVLLQGGDGGGEIGYAPLFEFLTGANPENDMPAVHGADLASGPGAFVGRRPKARRGIESAAMAGNQLGRLTVAEHPPVSGGEASVMG